MSTLYIVKPDSHNIYKNLN